MSSDYTPISCAFYDELESAAVKRSNNTIVYKDENEEKTIEAKVIDFKNINKEEFMLLDNELMIRLDKIITFNGMKPDIYDNCRNF